MTEKKGKFEGTKAERTAKELRKRDGLRNDVEDYHLCRHFGNVSGAKEVRRIIAKAIKKKGLDEDLVYGTKAYHKMRILENQGKDVRLVISKGVWKVVERK